MTSNPWREGFEVIVFRTVNDQPTLWDSILPPELLVLSAELGRVDALLDDPVFFAPFAAYFDARIGRPSIPMQTYLRLMFLKFRYRLGYESLCREVADSISWQRFCRISLGTRVPHPTTLMKITTRCGRCGGRARRSGHARGRRGDPQRQTCVACWQRAAQRPAAPGDQRPEHPDGTHRTRCRADP